MTISTVKDTTGLDELVFFTPTNDMIVIDGTAPSVIGNLVSGANQSWCLNDFEFLILQQEVQAGISPYVPAIDITQVGTTFTVTTPTDVFFYEQMVGNVIVSGSN